MTNEARPVFLDKATYRKRRMVDAARLLPALGLVLLAMPMLWSSAAGSGAATTYVMGYIFGVWLVLVLLGAALSSYLAAAGSETKGDTDPDRDV